MPGPFYVYLQVWLSPADSQFIMCMQDVTVCPFRVVDEINQGMDPINERKVFMQLVESACRPGTPQCFLLTPKLLPALPFTAAVQVLQIWNGPTIKQVVGSFDQASSSDPSHLYLSVLNSMHVAQLDSQHPCVILQQLLYG